MPSFIVTTLADENDSATAANPGGSGLSLREALALANADSDADTITFAPGLAGGSTPGTDDGRIALAFGQLEIVNSVALDGDTDGDADITIDAGGLSRGLNVVSGTSTLDAISIVDGANA
jgi:fibronectin-binding autotransporter adhesin